MRPVVSTLRGTEQPLTDLHDVALLDLDGVVYVGPDAVPGVPAALATVRERGVRLAFVTNNAARPPSVVAEHLVRLGIDADPDEVINSAQAAARYLAEHLPAGSTVLVLGTTGLHEALTEQGLVPVSEDDERVAAVVQGYSPDMNWSLLAEGAVAINRGVLWVATNVDPTVPSPRGPLPGNGSLVAALRCATRAEPKITGKPDPTMHRETVLRTGARRPIVVGDRLDTDIEGANAVGCSSLLVLSGVTTAADLLSAQSALRPTYLAADLAGLLQIHAGPQVHGARTTCGRWAVTTGDGGLSLELSGGGYTSSVSDADQPSGQTSASTVTDDDLDALRALCAAQWSRSEGRNEHPSVSAATGDDASKRVLARLGLDSRR